MILSELIERIKQEAVQIAPDAVNSHLLDSDVLIELVLPKCFEKVTADVVKDPIKLNALRRNHTITFASGTAALPAGVQEEYAESMYEYSATVAKTTSLEKNYFDYIGNTTNPLHPKFTVQNGNIYYKTGGAGVYAGDITFNAVTVPQLPTLISDAVTCPADILEQVIAFTASVISGQVSLRELGLDNFEQAK